MKDFRLHLVALSVVTLFFVNSAFAQNPLIMDQFTADPTARVFEGKVYVYPSHDIKAGSGRGRSGWFAMEDYHVFSSENLMDWTDHGVIVSQETVPWVNNNSFSMWAPDCVCKDGKYYFYFPAQNRIGVAVADKPSGPFKPEPNAIQGANGIDPCVLIDKDGSAYMYYSMNRIFVAKMKDNMLEFESRAQTIANLPTSGLVEGPFTFERNGIYYLTYPHAIRIDNHEAERLEYATGESPTGPFTQKGVIMDQSPSGCWTNHHSIVQYKDQWYLFYHDQDLSPDFDKNRSIRADYLSFNEDGTIQKVIPTLRGVGIADAKGKIQIDRYSAISDEGVTVSFLNDENTFEGWKISLDEKDAWVQFDRVDFGDSDLKSVKVRSVSTTGGSVEIRLDKADGTVLAKVEIPEGAEWKEADAKLDSVPSGEHGLVVTLVEGDGVELDWVSFE